MFSKNNTSRQYLRRQVFWRLSGVSILVATGLFILAGCGGGDGGTTSSRFAGNYQGVYLNTSPASSQNAGTLVISVTSSGTVTGTTNNTTGGGGTNDFSGTITDNGASGSGGTLTTNAVSGPVTENSTTHVFSTTYTQTNGTKGVLNIGLVPASSPLVGSYSGTFTATTGGPGTTTLTVSSAGAVTGTTVQAGVTGTISGYVDTNGNAYLAYKSSAGVPVNTIGAFTVNGILLTGTLLQSGADGSSNTITASLTKQ